MQHGDKVTYDLINLVSPTFAAIANAENMGAVQVTLNDGKVVPRGACKKRKPMYIGHGTFVEDALSILKDGAFSGEPWHLRPRRLRLRCGVVGRSCSCQALGALHQRWVLCGSFVHDAGAWSRDFGVGQ